MKPVLTFGAAAVAFAALVLLAPSAEAQSSRSGGPACTDPSHRHAPIYEGGHRYYGDRYYYGRHHRYDRRELRRDAARQCRRAIRRIGRDIGFREIEFDDRKVRQIGPYAFEVRFETEFEGRRREFERDVWCLVRRGRVVDIDGIPRPGRHGRRDRYDDHRRYTH